MSYYWRGLLNLKTFLSEALTLLFIIGNVFILVSIPLGGLYVVVHFIRKFW